VDAIHIDDDNIVHFYQFKNPEKLDGGISTTDIDKVISGLTVILNKTYKQIANQELVKKITEISKIIPAGYKLHIITSGCNKLEPEAITKLNGFIERLCAPSDDFFEYTYDNIIQLQDAFYKKNLPTVKNPIIFELSKTPYQVRSGEHDCYLFHLNSEKLAEIYQNHGEMLLQQNIRVAQGDTITNESIYQSCIGLESPNFMHYNNGITFICESATFDGFTSKLTLNKSQIINGGQTIRVLSNAKSDAKLKDDVLVPVRVITSAGNKEFTNNAATNLNNQNKMESSFLRSNHPRIIQLASSLLSIGYYLERREGELASLSANDREKIEKIINKSLDIGCINLKEGTQAYVATFYRNPELAKRNPKLIFLSQNEGGFFNKVFNDKLTAEKFIQAYKIKRNIDDFVTTFSSLKRRKNRISDWSQQLKELLGDRLFTDYGDRIDLVIPQCSIMISALIFDEYIRKKHRSPQDLLNALESNSLSLIQNKLYTIIDVADKNEDFSDISYTSLLKSQSYFNHLISI
jgi:hypothetical protein